MKANESIYNKERQKKILELLKQKLRISVKELSSKYNVSSVSIRNDLNVLAKTGLIVRTHGGAIYVEEFRGNEQRNFMLETEQSNISFIITALSGLIQTGDVIFIDSNLSSSLMYQLLSKQEEITVVTNKIDLAFRLASTTNLFVITPGGRINNDRLTIQADTVKAILDGYNISKAIFSPDGFSISTGLTDKDPSEVSLKKNVAENANLIICILNMNKFDTISLGTFARSEDVSILVTDDIPNIYKDFCVSNEIKVLTPTNKIDKKLIPNNITGFELYEKYCKHAVSRIRYPNQPGKGKKIGFANGFRKAAFCTSVEQSIVEQALLAGFSEENILILDNEYRSSKALENAERIYKSFPDVFIEFQTDSKTNNIIATKFRDKNIPLIALDIPIPGAMYIGLDNWKASLIAGHEAARLIIKKWKSWEIVDRIVIFQMSQGGEATMLRSEGFVESLEHDFGDVAENKILRLNIGIGTPEDAKRAVNRLLSDYASDKKIVMTSMTERGMREVIAELRNEDLWIPENYVIVTHGCDNITKSYIRNGTIDAAIAHFPERYGEYVIPAVCSLIQGNAVPPYVFVENMIITNDNIDQYYPER